MLPLREIDVLGVFVSPFALCLPVALLGAAFLVALLRRRPLTAAGAHSSLFELGLFSMLLSLLVLTLGRI